jgi:hypothetical protein
MEGKTPDYIREYAYFGQVTSFDRNQGRDMKQEPALHGKNLSLNFVLLDKSEITATKEALQCCILLTPSTEPRCGPSPARTRK